MCSSDLNRPADLLAVAAAAAVTAAIPGYGLAQQIQAAPLPNIAPLTGISPVTADTSGIIRDKLAAQQLGKALFWDIAAGSDGMACASCHFHGGADIRIKNQVNPGLAQVFPGPDKSFSNRRSGTPTGPNVELNASDFPFHQLANPLDRQSAVVYDTNDVFSSAGTFSGPMGSSPTLSNSLKGSTQINRLLGLQAASSECQFSYDPVNNPFHTGNYTYRKVEPRQSPSTINAVFNFRNFWDGRANNVFNGVDPFGRRTNLASAKAGVLVSNGATLSLQKVALENASLASQAVGPPLSSFEMSCEGRTFADLGRKLLPARPLAYQAVDSQDSLFSRKIGRAPV